MLVNNRLAPSLVDCELAEYSRDHPHKKIVLIVDYEFSTDTPNVVIVNAKTSQPDIIDAFAPDKILIIYAVDQDDVGVPYIRWLVEKSIKFYPVFLPDPACYAHKDILAREAIEEEYIYQNEHGFAKFDFGYSDFENICQALKVTKHLPGSYVEVGCFRGSSGSVALSYMKKADILKPAYFLDVFEGFNYQAAETSADAIWNNTHATEGIEIVTDRLSRFTDPDHGWPISVYKNNIITDELPDEIGPIAVANLDVDMFEAVYAGLLRLAPHILPGGILIVEDPGHTPLLVGAALALDMFLATPSANGFVPLYMRSGQYFLVKHA